MLVLSRFKNEKVVIVIDGQAVAEVSLVEIRRNKVRLGFAADKSVGIHREEVWDRIQRGEGDGDAVPTPEPV